MKSKGLAVGIVLLFVVTAIIPSTAQNIEKSTLPTMRGNWLYVGGSGPGNYSSVQAAIDNASAGDHIFIYPGIYNGNLSLRKPLTLQGQDANTTIIDGCLAYRTLYVNTTEFHIQSLGFRNTSFIEIWIDTANDSSITDCRFTGNLTANTFGGLRIDKAARLHIQGCTVINYLDGISAINTIDSIIERCLFSNQQRSVSINLGCSNCSVDNCTFIGNPEFFNRGPRGIDVYSQNNLITNCILTNLTEGICMFDCSNFTNIINCTISNCTQEGIQSVNAHDHLIERCKISYCNLDSSFNGYAMEIWDSDNIIDSCTIKNNPDGGVEFIWLGDHNTLRRSTLIHNGYGSDSDPHEGLYCGSYNHVYLNNFIDNRIQARDQNGFSTWDNGTLGNYWSDYTGFDRNHDAIGDTPYQLSSKSNNDTCPLFCPYNPDGPSVRIILPVHTQHTYLYFRNIKLVPFPTTILLGTTRVTVCAIDYNSLDAQPTAEFFVDGRLRHTDRTAPFVWIWRIHSYLHHTHTLDVTVTDHLGTAHDTLLVKKFF